MLVMGPKNESILIVANYLRTLAAILEYLDTMQKETYGEIVTAG